ncbi:MAG: photosynthetic complex assembly protein PuhC [Pseudomonadota bacterium]
MAKTDLHLQDIDAHQAAVDEVYDKERIQRIMMRGVFVLLMVILALVALSRLTDRPLVAVPPVTEVVDTREIVLESDTSGRAFVRDVDGTVLVDLGPGEGGFLHTMWRAVQRERVRYRVDQGGPVTVNLHEDGRLRLFDPSTGGTIDLNAFGSKNIGAFRALLED